MNKTLEVDRLVQLEPSPIGDASSPLELVPWALKHFAGMPMILTTSFGMEGCALIDIFSRYTTTLTVAYIDTGFFFPETNQLRDQMVKRYPNIEFEKWETPISLSDQKENYGDNLWRDNPNLCCHIRKVVPMKQNIGRYRFWITALRKSQTENRATIPVVGWDWKYQVLKFCPFANWTRPDVWNYIQQNDVPFNQLHLQEYPSVSCYHCTKPVPGSTPDGDSRQGRWQGKEKTECGLHYSI